MGLTKGSFCYLSGDDKHEGVYFEIHSRNLLNRKYSHEVSTLNCNQRYNILGWLLAITEYEWLLPTLHTLHSFFSQ